MRPLVLVAALALACSPERHDEADAGTDAGADLGVDVGTDAGRDAGHDAGRDLGVDLGTDSGRDVGVDLGTDLGVDSGPPCVCSFGDCCDGCNIRPAGYVYGEMIREDCVGSRQVCINAAGRFHSIAIDRARCDGVSPYGITGWNTEVSEMIDCWASQNYATYARCEVVSGVATCVDGPNCTAITSP